MLLKLLLNVLLVYVVYRLVRGLFRPSRVRPRGQPDPKRLDPERAVRASWSEVEEDDGEDARES